MDMRILGWLLVLTIPTASVAGIVYAATAWIRARVRWERAVVMLLAAAAYPWWVLVQDLFLRLARGRPLPHARVLGAPFGAWVHVVLAWLPVLAIFWLAVRPDGQTTKGGAADRRPDGDTSQADAADRPFG